jgi:DNA-binding response OmpR family regulator
MALKAGANDYVIKPFKPELLIERVKQVIGQCKAAA